MDSLKKMVQTMKRILQKSQIDGKDPYTSLLEYRNTSTDVDSPAQLLMSRKLRSILPVMKRQLQPKVVSSSKIKEKRKLTQNKQIRYFNSGQRNLSQLTSDQKIRFQHRGHWTPGFVKRQVHDRSYNVENLCGDEYRRNRKDIIASLEENFRKFESDVGDIIDDSVASEAETCTLDDSMPADMNSTTAKPERYRARSGREVRIPKHYSGD
jgi:hypothetical protein